MRFFAMCVLLLGSAFNMGFAEQSSANTTSSTCSFQDGKQITVRYVSEATEDKAPPSGKVWMPGGQPMWLFTQAELSVANSAIPIGAYSLYIIPEKEIWTLVVNKNVTTGSSYDEHQDLARVTMELGHLSEAPKQLRVAFGHVAPKQCNMRVYYGNTGAWAEVREK